MLFSCFLSHLLMLTACIAAPVSFIYITLQGSSRAPAWSAAPATRLSTGQEPQADRSGEAPTGSGTPSAAHEAAVRSALPVHHIALALTCIMLFK